MLNYIYEHDNLKKNVKVRMTNNELTSHLFRYSKFFVFVFCLKLILSYTTENTIFEIG